jgi:hypothetical protein
LVSTIGFNYWFQLQVSTIGFNYWFQLLVSVFVAPDVTLGAFCSPQYTYQKVVMVIDMVSIQFGEAKTNHAHGELIVLLFLD